jgi:hypothetical protein
MSFSPFAIDTLKPDNSANLAQAYEVLRQLSPQILAAQGTGKMCGFRSQISYDGVASDHPTVFELGGYRFTASYGDKDHPEQAIANNGGLIIQTGENEFLVAGQGVTLTFEDRSDAHMAVGIEQDLEGKYVDGQWKTGRWLNGDETLEGRHLHLPGDHFSIQKLTLYKFR